MQAEIEDAIASHLENIMAASNARTGQVPDLSSLRVTGKLNSNDADFLASPITDGEIVKAV